MTKQSVINISAQLNVTVNYDLFWSCSDNKKNHQHKSEHTEKIMTCILYYDNTDDINKHCQLSDY